MSVYEKSIPLIGASNLMYSFAEIIEAQRRGEYNVIEKDVFAKYEDCRFDAREMNGGKGYPVREIVRVITKAREHDEKDRYRSSNLDREVFQNIRDVEKLEKNNEIFLLTFNVLRQARQCVYGIFKNTLDKKVVIAFRGSVSSGTKDWPRNFQAYLSRMETPPLLQADENNGVGDTVTVHRGFYEYLFENKMIISGDQRMIKIMGDLKSVLEPGYELVVTGHSLGAALASITAFHVAGSDEKWIPKPITCYSYESPLCAGLDFRIAFKQLEKRGLIKYLRVSNSEDPIPTAPPCALNPCDFGLFKHFGVHLTLYENTFTVDYPQKNNRWKRAFANNTFGKSLTKALHFHSLSTVMQRFNTLQDELKEVSIDDFYKDKDIVGEDFLLSNV